MENDTEENNENNLNLEKTNSEVYLRSSESQQNFTENDNDLIKMNDDVNENIKNDEGSVFEDSEFIEKSIDVCRIEEEYSEQINKNTEGEENNDENEMKETKEEEENSLKDEMELDIEPNEEMVKEIESEEVELAIEDDKQKYLEGEEDVNEDNIVKEEGNFRSEVYEEIKEFEEKEYKAEDKSFNEIERENQQNDEDEIVKGLVDNEEPMIENNMKEKESRNGISVNDDANENENKSENEIVNGTEHNSLLQNEVEDNVNKSNQINEEDSLLVLKDQDNKEDTVKDIEVKLNDNNISNMSVTNFCTVPIQRDDGSVKNQLVTIITYKYKKPFLGGYRHRVSKKEYHHAMVQTLPKPRLLPNVQLFSRDTQTFQLKHQKINTDNTMSTQMTKPGVYVSNVTDKLVPIKHYETADEYEERMLGNIITIQKYYRRWLAKNIVEEKRKQRDDRLQWENNKQKQKIKEKEEKILNEYQRRMHPKTKADFDLLYSDLEKWREEQLNDIENSNITLAEKKTKRVLLLEEETDLLAAIDRHKIDRKGETKVEAVQKLLSKAAAPKSWKDSKGRKIEMDTQFTIRSRELLEIFNSLNMQYLTSDERLDVLLTLKHTVKEHDCKLTKEIVELVNREADLIMRNMKDVSLAGLRKRISTLFLQYCKTPTFNPQISLLLKVPPDPSVLIGDINYCKYCGRYLRSTEFSLSTKSSKLTICKSCARKDNQSRNRQDYSHYRRILKEIQMNEQQIEDKSKVAFIFKQNDIKSLIESVWDSKSILSGCDDLDELVFLRWDQKEYWSPWNTIFVTKDEAEAHLKVTSLTETYSNVLINRIVQKHVIARNIFGSLEKMVYDFQSKSLTATVKV